MAKQPQSPDEDRKDWVPPRPWAVEIRPHSLCVCGLENDGSFGGAVFYLNYDHASGAHQPIEQARAEYIVRAVNLFDRLDQLLASTPADHEEGRRLAWLGEKLGIAAAPAGKLKPPIIGIAGTRAELAEWRVAELPHLVAVVLNRFRAKGDPEKVCEAYMPSLTAALGAWWDEHFTCGEDLSPEPTPYEKMLAEVTAGKGDDPAD